jgi:hypothetical protein
MCAGVSFEKMCTVAKAFAWARCLLSPDENSGGSADARQYFIWDDCKLSANRDPKIESLIDYCCTVFDCGCLTHDKTAIPEYRDKSMQYFRTVLSSREDATDLSGCSDELQKALLCWDEVAAHIRAVCSEGISYRWTLSSFYWLT